MVAGTQPQVAQIFGRIAGPDAPVVFEAYDGSTSGLADAPVRIEVRSPMAMSYLLCSPGELGVARAYVTGHLGVAGDLYAALDSLSDVMVSLDLRTRLDILRRLGPRYLRPVPAPPEEGPGLTRRVWQDLRHSRSRDSRAVSYSYHYDVSNRFYEWLLGSSMAASCGYFADGTATLEEAQEAKFDLVCRKLGLRPGMRMLDVGCGWGGMVMHAARNYGVHAMGVTLSRQQAEWAQKAIVEAGLADLAEVRHMDYRDVSESGFDAVSSIGFTERVGRRNLPAYFRFLHSKLGSQGRLLNHCVARPATRERHGTGLFVDRYIFPESELAGVGEIVSAMQDNGFEIRHGENLREHYARTLATWGANLEAHWDESVKEIGAGKARVWALCVAACRLGFDRRRIELHQILGVRTAGNGASGMSLRPGWEPRES